MENWRSRIVGQGEEAPAALIPNPRNWRTHPKAQLEALGGALDEVGWVQQVIVNKQTGHLVDGHARVELALAREESAVPVVYVDLSENEEAIVLASLDPLAGLVGTDQGKLDALLAEATVADGALRTFLGSIGNGASGGLTDDDAVPDVPEEPVTQPGDLYVLGDHRLLCGDATKPDDVERLMDGEKADILIADPPYGMRLNADYSSMKGNLRFLADKAANGGNRYEDVAGDDVDFDAAPVRSLWPASEQFWFGADYYASSLGDTEHGGSWMVWDKRLEESADEMFGSCFELVWSAERHKRLVLRHKWAGIFGSEHEDAARAHPTQKPLVLLIDLLTRWAGGLVADPFLGSGTTMIACEKLGRRCYGMEIEPRYVDVAVRRWEEYTGRGAEREGHKATANKAARRARQPRAKAAAGR